MTRPKEVSATEARRIALLAQGMGVARDAAPTKARLLAEVQRLGVLQIDSVNVVARAHYLPLFARLGAYDTKQLDALAWSESPTRRRLFEYWGHQASLLPMELYPLFRWRMQRAIEGKGTWGRIARFANEKRAYLQKVLREIEARGPTAASELAGEKKAAGGWWVWSEAKHAVETLFWQGRLAVASRRGSFERLYDLPERVIPSAQRDAKPVPDEAAHRALLERSARFLGIGTEDDLADVYRLARAECRPRLRELVEAGVLVDVNVEGWDRPAFVHAGALRAKGRVDGVAALVGPFDPVVWHRPRALRMFGFHYRIGIYTPAHQRTHGYYVLPFLLGDAIAAQVDLKADRASRTLLVQAAWLEKPQAAEAVAPPLANELRRMAQWLGLDAITVARKGTLAPALSRSLRA